MPRHGQSGASVDIGGRGKGANTSLLSTEEARVFQLIADAIHLGHIKYRTCVPLYFVSTVDVGRQKLFMGGLRRTGYLISPTPPRGANIDKAFYQLLSAFPSAKKPIQPSADSDLVKSCSTGDGDAAYLVRQC